MNFIEKMKLVMMWLKREKMIKGSVDDLLRRCFKEAKDLSYSTGGRSVKFPAVHRVQVFLVIPKSVDKDFLTLIIPELVNRYSPEYHVVWFEIAHSKENADLGIWFCQLQWISEKLDKSLRPDPLKGNDIIKGIEVKWG